MKRIVWFLALVCLLGSVAMAQNAQLSGVVKDKTGAVVPQAEVTLKNVDTAAMLHTKTSKVGFFIFQSVQPGRYDLSAGATGFDLTVVKAIKLDTAANISQDLMLQIKQGAETVTVTQQAGLIAEDGTVSTVIDRTQIENMPLNGKDLQTLFEITPGTVLNAGSGQPADGGGFSVDGQRPTANYLTVDGANANAYVPSAGGPNVTGSTIAISASGGTNGILPIDAIEEYRMDTSTYSAENGRTPGGQIQVKTRSGTNLFHGTLFENLRNQAFDATDWFVKYDGVKQTPLRMNDFGGTVSGPVIIPHLFDGKNKLFFFVAHDTLVLNQPSSPTTQDVPDASLVASSYPAFQKLLAAFPAGNGGADPTNPGFDFFSSSFPFEARDHTTSVRIDANLPKAIHAFFRANIAPSFVDQPAIPAGTSTHDNIYTYTGGFTAPLGNKIVNEFTLNHTSYDSVGDTFSTPSAGGNNPFALQNNLPNGVNSTIDDFSFALGPLNYNGPAVGPGGLNSLSQWNIVDRLSWDAGKHQIRGGVDFLTKQVKLRLASSDYAVYTAEDSYPYPSLQDGIVTSLAVYGSLAFPNISIANTSLYINDNWRVASNVNINLGLRWDYNPPPSVGPLGVLAIQGNTFDPATVAAALSTKDVYSPKYDNFAPRIGFSWSSPSHKALLSSLRGGLGIFFDTGQAATVSQGQAGGYPYQTNSYISTPQAYDSINWTSESEGAGQQTLPTSPLYLVDPHLISPRTYEWSLTVEQKMGTYVQLSTSYIGNDGEKLVGEEEYHNLPSSTGAYPVNPSLIRSYGELYYITNQSHSNYQALQSQLVIKAGSKADGLISYTWSHAEDNGSTDYSSVGEAVSNPISNSANDIRHILAAAIHYAPQGTAGSGVWHAVTRGWSLDTIARLQTASPFTITVGDALPNVFDANADVVPGVPVILREHLDSFGKVVPGNRLLNWAAFTAPPTDSQGSPLRQGDSPTNGYRLFGLAQWDLAVSRDWKIWKEANLDFRVDAFNVLNAANFAGVSSGWTSKDGSSFGRATNTYAGYYGGSGIRASTTGSQLAIFQNGGPRSIQFSVKLKF